MNNYGYIFFIPKQKPKSIGGIFGILTGLFTQKKGLPPFAHCGIMINDKQMIHAWYSVKMDNINDIAVNYDGYAIYKCNCDKYSHSKAVNYAVNRIGTLYDIVGLFGIIRKYLIDKYNKSVTINKYDKSKMDWCSELVLDCLKDGGCQNAELFKNGFESPADIANFDCMCRLC